MKIWLIKYGEPLNIFEKNREYRMSMLANELINNDENEVVYWTGTFEHNTKKQIFNKSTFINKKSNYKIQLLFHPKYKKNFSLRRIFSIFYLSVSIFIKMMKSEKPDVLVVSYPFTELVLSSLLYSRIKSVKLIIDVRDLWPDATYYSLSRIKKIFFYPFFIFYRVWFSVIVNNAKNIISISDGFRDWTLTFLKRNRSHNYQVIPIGYNHLVDKKHIEHSKKKYDKKFYFLNAKYVFTFIGVINRHYNFNPILEAAKLLETQKVDCVFCICGVGEDLKKLKSLTKKNKITNIYFTDWINKQEIDYILLNSFIGLAPYIDTLNFRNNITNKIYEYMSFGIPIIASANGKLKDFITNNKIGRTYSDLHNDEIISALKFYCENKKEYSETKKKSLVLYETQFKSSVVYRKFKDYICSVVAEK